MCDGARPLPRRAGCQRWRAHRTVTCPCVASASFPAEAPSLRLAPGGHLAFEGTASALPGDSRLVSKLRNTQSQSLWGRAGLGLRPKDCEHSRCDRYTSRLVSGTLEPDARSTSLL